MALTSAWVSALVGRGRMTWKSATEPDASNMAGVA